ncbi:MAG TPA: hypothetical protein VGJ60_03495 [Chloroflexota bacterium]
MGETDLRTVPRREPSGGMTVSHPDLEWRETIRGAKPGDRFVRIATHKGFTRIRRGYLVPRPGTGEPTTGVGRGVQRLKHLVLGTPIPTAREAHERLNKVRALAVFSSDALSSVAYGGEEIMKVLILAGAGALALTLPISAVIVLLLAIVVLSYRQTIRAYPSGGGSYIVASDNLGMLPGLTAAGALLIDYVLTVSVSVAAGVAALTSMVPDWLPYTVPMTVGAGAAPSQPDRPPLESGAAVSPGDCRGQRAVPHAEQVHAHASRLAISYQLVGGLFGGRFDGVDCALHDASAAHRWSVVH